MTDRSQERGRQPFIPLAILGACVAPLAAAWMLTSSGIGWQPKAMANAGKLVSPPVLLKTAGLRLSNGQALAADGLRGRWRIAAFAVNSRDANDRLTTMRRVQLALGKTCCVCSACYFSRKDRDRWIKICSENTLSPWC